MTNGTQACLNITIVDDDVFESDHDFGVFLAAASPPSVAVGFPTFSIITIQDNDGKSTDISSIVFLLLLI